MNRAAKILADAFGLARICGFGVALRWLACIALKLPAILRTHNLQPADMAMGPGPYRVRLAEYDVRFQVQGQQVISGIREMYVRDTYLRHGTLSIKEGDFVVDLGANLGNFTNLALAHGANITVLAVEPGKHMNAAFSRSLGLNVGHIDRSQLVSAFVGLMAVKQTSAMEDHNYVGAEWISEQELIKRGDIDHIDFLKCDIEGGEFGLLTADSELLKMTQSLAVEVHHFAGDVDRFLQMLRDHEFTILDVQRDGDGTATALATRRPEP